MPDFSENTTMKITQSLTWNKTALITGLSLAASVALGLWLVSARIFLAPPLFGYSFSFYVFIGLAPALGVWLVCFRMRPSGSYMRMMLTAILGGVMLLFYGALIHPGFYSDISCQSEAGPTGTGRQTCVCRWQGNSESSSVNCTAEQVPFLPLTRLSINTQIP